VADLRRSRVRHRPQVHQQRTQAQGRALVGCPHVCR
jgi:hypothetical protein